MYWDLHLVHLADKVAWLVQLLAYANYLNLTAKDSHKETIQCKDLVVKSSVKKRGELLTRLAKYQYQVSSGCTVLQCIRVIFGSA